MIKLNLIFGFAIFLTNTIQATDPPLPKGRRLREIVDEKFPDGNVYVGGTTGWNKRPKGSGIIVDREFNYSSPENDFKQSRIHPQPEVWRWDLADNWIKHCKEKKQVIRIHGPISPQCSKWAKDDSRTTEELKQNLEEFMTALCKRYDKYEHVKWMDVINETILQNGNWFGPKKGVDKWENPWPKIGFDNDDPLKPPLYIKMAFEIANKHAPNTKLIINQHAGMEDKMWDKIKAMVKYLRKNNLRVDGIGWQAHIDTGWEQKPENIKRLHALIKWAHENKLSFHVTEMNSWLKGEKKDFEAQAKTFAAVFKALLEHRDNGVVTWNVWNISDKDAWQNEKMKEGCLFDREYKAKPGYYELQKLLDNPPPAK